VQKTGLQITSSIHGTVIVVHLAGFLDGHTFIDLEKYLEAIQRAGQRRMIMDLSGLTYIASAGVGLFINIQHRLKNENGNLQLVKPSQSVAEIFSILGLDSLFTIHATVEAGIEAAKA